MVSLPPDSFLHDMERLTRAGGRRWRSLDGERLYEWDAEHGHVEGYSKRGLHVGVFHARTGIKIRDPVKGRKIDV